MRNKGFASILDKYSRVMLLLVIIIGMSILRPDAFLTWSNMSTVIFQQAPFTMLMSFGMTPPATTRARPAPTPMVPKVVIQKSKLK